MKCHPSRGFLHFQRGPVHQLERSESARKSVRGMCVKGQQSTRTHVNGIL